MSQISDLSTIRVKNKRKRLIGWVLLYLALIVIFMFTLFWQIKKVNTLNFASGELQLSTSKTKYTVGDTISYTLKNGLTKPITFINTCPQEPLYVYSWINNSWIRIHDTARASSCNNLAKQRTILPGNSYTQSFASWPNLFNKPGIYRIVALSTNYRAIPYADFQVVAKPSIPKIQTQVIIQKVITPIYITPPSYSGHDGGSGSGDN